MNAVDRFLQRWRIAVAGRWIHEGSRILDVGSFDGAIFRHLGERVAGGVGIDPRIGKPGRVGSHRLVPGRFPDALPPGEPPFDAITMLAVLEHLPPDEVDAVASACAAALRPGGRLIVTVPSPLVDPILAVLRLLRVVEAPSLEEHHGFRPARATGIFTRAGLVPLRRRRFQLGLNNLFVFRKPDDGAPKDAEHAVP